MGEASIASLRATHRRVAGVFRRSGHPRTPGAIWGLLRATPMIGQNDVDADVFTLADADTLVHFGRRAGLGGFSLWSANRDSPCPVSLAPPIHSNVCSGVDQRPGEFSTRSGERFYSGWRRGGQGVRRSPREVPFPAPLRF